MLSRKRRPHFRGQGCHVMPTRLYRRLFSLVRARWPRLQPPAPLAQPPLFGFLDSPVANQPVNGLFQVSGWELHRSGGASAILIYLDDQLLDTPVRRIPRPDVTRAFLDLAADNPFPGFSAAIATTELSAGR